VGSVSGRLEIVEVTNEKGTGLRESDPRAIRKNKLRAAPD